MACPLLERRILAGCFLESKASRTHDPQSLLGGKLVPRSEVGECAPDKGSSFKQPIF